MFDAEHVEAILNGIVNVNTLLGYWAILVPVLLAVAIVILVYRAYAAPSVVRSRAVLGTLVVAYGFAGLQVFLASEAMGAQMAMIGAGGLWFVGVLLLLDAIFSWTEVRLSSDPFLKVASITLMLTGIVIYPIVEVILGFTWPRMALFGAECPTTIFLIGLLIGCVPKVNRVLFVLVSLNAMGTGFSVAINGAAFDHLYGLAGVFGVVAMIIHFRELFMKRPKLGAPAG